MTEKQFIQKGYSIINTQTDELVNASSDESAEIITDWLNDLSNKYAEVRKENYGNLDGINYYQEENGHLSERISDLEYENEELKKQRYYLYSDIVRLVEENEQLKQENRKLKEDLEHCANQFTNDGKNVLLSLR